ncbi:MAG TPA: S53 family serine peptidase [Bryobacteraceae bacterium]|nr:S53 family serine peptidase [Bryobacteraceae bacterium]
MTHSFFARAAAILLIVLAAKAQKLNPVSPAPLNQTVQFEVFLPLENSSQLDQLISNLNTSGSANYHQWLTPQQFRTQFGTNQQTLSKVSKALAAYGLTVTATHTSGLHFQGSVAAVQQAFGAQLWNAKTPSGAQKIVATQALKLPPVLTEAGAQVVAFSPVIWQHVHSVNMGARPLAQPLNRFSPTGPYFFDDLKQAYDFPSAQVLNGKGATIGIVMASDVLDSDLALYFGYEHTTPPKLVRVPIDGGAPFNINNPASIEASLDVQQAGGMALGATIVLYNTPDLSDQSVFDAYQTIVETNAVDIVSNSFGGPEGVYTAAYNGGTDYTGILRMFDDLIRQGNAEGITFVASSGDNGGLELPSLSYFLGEPGATWQPGVEWPASLPHVTAVGGTNLVTSNISGSLQSTYVSENAFGDPLLPYDPFGVGNTVSGGYWGSGGGSSVVFQKPLYQFLVNTGSSMRSVPDISMQMGGCPAGISAKCGSDFTPPFPESEVVAAIGGNFYGLIGTSTGAQDFAGLLALERQNLGIRLGNVNFLIYALAALQNVFSLVPDYHQNIPGFNGLFSSSAHGGYNMVVGNGTPFGKNFILAPFAPAAGNPQTPSNP